MQGDESRVISTGAGSDDGVRRFRSPGTFDPDKEDWNLYEIRFLAAIRVARVTDDADKSGLLISSLSPAVFKRLYNLLQPRNIMEVPFKDLTATLSDHFTPKRFKEFERYKLFSNRQEDGESVKDFVERLSAIISRCEYEGESDVRACSLMTAFIVGLRDQRIRARLVLEKTLTMDTAIRLAESFLAAEAESKQLHAGTLCAQGDSQAGEQGTMFPGTRKKGKHFRKVKLVTDVFLADGQDGKFIACSIKDKDVILQVDTGSRATLLDERTFKRLGEPELYQSPYRLRAFNKDEIPLRGAADLDVSIGGRGLIRELGIDLNTLFVGKILTAPKLEGVLGTYPDLFRSQLGRCTKALVHLHLKKDAEPKFFKPRPILLRLGKRLKLTCNVVPKPNGAVRVCGDFSVTVNPQIEIAQFPLPRPEELLATLNGGEKFTKLDLSEAYLQMELDEEAKKILVINTHKGLFQFNRMPFGIASAPAVFQRTMEQVIAGIPSVPCYLDDIIVTGRNDKEHLETLVQVLSRLREFGFTLKREKCAFLKRQVEYLGHVVTAEGF
ncbi:uncharacterized protein K02A2.6-like [Ornithodoros turicata]|uniref:uncharacterized protein K02A2.6-like n=1 Tax=Ornithodoros turicata TaxID=34597 RepID=UPI00313A1E3F